MYMCCIHVASNAGWSQMNHMHHMAWLLHLAQRYINVYICDGVYISGNIDVMCVTLWVIHVAWMYIDVNIVGGSTLWYH